jgi:hypothetical protein
MQREGSISEIGMLCMSVYYGNHVIAPPPVRRGESPRQDLPSSVRGRCSGSDRWEQSLDGGNMGAEPWLLCAAAGLRAELQDDSDPDRPGPKFLISDFVQD